MATYLVGADLSASQFDFSIFEKADLRGVDLRDTSFRDVDAEEANFGINSPDETELPEARTEGLDLTRADLHRAAISLPQILSAKGYDASPSCLAILGAVYADNPHYRDVTRAVTCYQKSFRMYEELFRREVRLDHIERAAEFVKRALDVKAAMHKLKQVSLPAGNAFQNDRVNLLLTATTQTGTK